MLGPSAPHRSHSFKYPEGGLRAALTFYQAAVAISSAVSADQLAVASSFRLALAGSSYRREDPPLRFRTSGYAPPAALYVRAGSRVRSPNLCYAVFQSW